MSDPPEPMPRAPRWRKPKRFDGQVSLRLPSTLHDELCREAHQRHVELSEVMRERLTKGGKRWA